jgi:RNA polymerase sigma factor (sigma-70 family)
MLDDTLPMIVLPILTKEFCLVERLKAMDSSAWETFFDSVQEELRRGIIASLRRRNLSLDLVDDFQQETWLTAIKRIHEYESNGEPRLINWLRAISFNHIRNFVRKRDADTSMQDWDESENYLSCDADLFTSGQTGHTIEDDIILRERLSGLDKAMQHLRPQDRELVLRRWMWQEKPEELALCDPTRKSRSITRALLRAKASIRHHCDDTP